MNAVTQVAPLIGRILVAAIFLWSGIGKIGGFEGTLGYMTAMGVPMAQVARGEAVVNGQKLSAGDGAAIEAETEMKLASPSSAEVLVFDLP